MVYALVPIKSHSLCHMMLCRVHSLPVRCHYNAIVHVAPYYALRSWRVCERQEKDRVHGVGWKNKNKNKNKSNTLI